MRTRLYTRNSKMPVLFYVRSYRWVHLPIIINGSAVKQKIRGTSNKAPADLRPDQLLPLLPDYFHLLLVQKRSGPSFLRLRVAEQPGCAQHLVQSVEAERWSSAGVSIRRALFAGVPKMMRLSIII